MSPESPSRTAHSSSDIESLRTSRKSTSIYASAKVLIARLQSGQGDRPYIFILGAFSDAGYANSARTCAGINGNNGLPPAVCAGAGCEVVVNIISLPSLGDIYARSAAHIRGDSLPFSPKLMCAARCISGALGPRGRCEAPSPWGEGLELPNL